MGLWDDLVEGGSNLLDDFLYNEVDGGRELDWRSIVSAGGGVASALGLLDADQQRTGYQGGIPTYSPTRARVANTYDPDRRPGSGGQRYFSGLRYSSGDSKAADEAATADEAIALATANAANPAREGQPDYSAPPIALAGGGLASLPRNSTPKQGGRYMRGLGSGMADSRPATIEGAQPAALSDGEFVLPADVVSHLGNGNSQAGAQQLYNMMDRVRAARTGTTQQGAPINPQRYMPR